MKHHMHNRPPELFNRENLESLYADPAYSSERLIGFMSLRYATEYEADAGIREGYSIATHSAMVVHQYDLHELDTALPAPMDQNAFRTMLALHDIGKPQAIHAGDKKRQHEFTAPLMDDAFSTLEYPAQVKDFAIATVCNDVIGNTIREVRRGNTAIYDANALRLQRKADACNVPPAALFAASLLLYKVDTASYTEQAGGSYDYASAKGHGSLAFLFDFTQPSQELRFAENIQSIVNNLGDTIAAM